VITQRCRTPAAVTAFLRTRTYLPAVTAPTAVTSLRPAAADDSPARILMVDDRPANLVALQAILSPLGAELVRATSGEDALRKLLQGEFAVILMDVEMPVLDGIATASLIRKRDRTRSVPIIFLTAIAKDPSCVFEGYSHGAVDYLVKPLDPEILRAKVSVFVDLWKKGELIKRQESLLRAQERRELERRNELRFRAVTDSIPACVWVAGPDGAISYANHFWRDYAGPYARGGLFGAVPDGDREILEASWRHMVATGAPLEREQRIRRYDGQYRWHLLRVVPETDESGEIAGWTAIGTDIDDRKRMEEARQSVLVREQEARVQAELANRSKDEFLAAVSHELRTPLNAIVGWTRMLSAGEVQDGEKVACALRTIERNARAQIQLVDDLLDVSRIVAGKLRVGMRAVEVGSVVEQAIEGMRPAAETHGIELTLQSSHRAPVLGDPDRLRQVIWNLLGNSIKFTPPGGKVTVDVLRAEPQVEIVVTDTGIGINRDFLPHVFDRFRQADSSLARSAGGLGLGLNIVLHLVELHGGTVRAESEGEGKGARFVVLLPISQVDAEPLPQPVPLQSVRPARQALLGMRILVVDDEPDARQLTAEILGSYAAEVVVAGTAAAALERIRERGVDVLVTDIGLPGEDGYSLLRRVRALPGGSEIAAIALTAYATQQDSRRAAEAGFQRHLSKPIDPLYLVAVLADLAAARTSPARLAATQVPVAAAAAAV